jgi:hypothetical protein
MDAIERRIWELCEEGKALSRARDKALEEAAAKRPKVVSEIDDLPMAVWRKRARKALEGMMDAERNAFRQDPDRRTLYDTLRGMAYTDEVIARQKDRRLMAQDAIDNVIELKRELAAHERWLKRRGIRKDGNGNYVDYDPMAWYDEETRS